MAAESRHRPPLSRFFTRLIDDAFIHELGVVDPEVTNYLGDMLASFAHMDSIYRIRNLRGRRLEAVGEMLAESDVMLDASSFAREREVHKHIGDFTLFWTGLYPESLSAPRWLPAIDRLVDYVRQGKRSYAIAASFQHGDYAREARVLARLSDHYELCAHGLRLTRTGWERMARKQADSPR